MIGEISDQVESHAYPDPLTREAATRMIEALVASRLNPADFTLKWIDPATGERMEAPITGAAELLPRGK